MTFFTFDGYDYHLFDTEDQALKCAQEALDFDFDEEWSDEVEKILVGVVTHVVTEASVVLRDDLDEEGCFDGRYYHGDYDRWVDYVLTRCDSNTFEAFCERNQVSDAERDELDAYLTALRINR